MRPCIILIALSLAVPAAWGQSVYKWIDDDGKVHYSHSVPPERVEDAHERLATDGRVIERIERAPPLEQRQRLAEELAEADDASEQARIRANRDRLLLAAYPTRSDLERSMQAELDMIRSERNSLQISLQSAQAYFRELVARAAEKERRSEPVPGELTERIADGRQRVAEIHTRLERLDQRLKTAEHKFQADLERYLVIEPDSRG